MPCPRCKTVDCDDPDSKGCSDILLMRYREERDQWERAYRLLATETIYDGNSTYHWWAKAKAYSGIVFEVCEAFRKLGYSGEMGDLPTLAARLNEFVQTVKARSTDSSKEK